MRRRNAISVDRPRTLASSSVAADAEDGRPTRSIYRFTGLRFSALKFDDWFSAVRSFRARWRRVTYTKWAGRTSPAVRADRRVPTYLLEDGARQQERSRYPAVEKRERRIPPPSGRVAVRRHGPTRRRGQGTAFRQPHRALRARRSPGCHGRWPGRSRSTGCRGGDQYNRAVAISPRRLFGRSFLVGISANADGGHRLVKKVCNAADDTARRDDPPDLRPATTSRQGSAAADVLGLPLIDAPRTLSNSTRSDANGCAPSKLVRLRRWSTCFTPHGGPGLPRSFHRRPCIGLPPVQRSSMWHQ